MKNGFTHILVVLCVVLVIVAGGVIYQRNIKVSESVTNEPQASSNFKTFKSSDVMDFSIKVPFEYEVVDKIGRIDLVKNNSIIVISRNGTNFDSLEDAINDLDLKNKTTGATDNRFSVNSYDVMRRELTRNDGVQVLIYYIKISEWIYVIETSDLNLSDDLDQIAKSFKYTPN